MTTELEEHFFKVYGIEPKIEDGCKYADNYWKNEKLANRYGTLDLYLKEKCPYENKECYSICNYAYDQEVYPKITAEKLLELVYIIGVKPYGFLYINDTYSTNINSRTDIVLIEADDFKEGVLTLAIQPRVQLRIKQQVRALFGGEE